MSYTITTAQMNPAASEIQAIVSSHAGGTALAPIIDTLRSGDTVPRGPDRRSAAPTVPRRLAEGLEGGVGEGGLEPPRPCGHRHLKPARLPIPPLARVERRG